MNSEELGKLLFQIEANVDQILSAFKQTESGAKSMASGVTKSAQKAENSIVAFSKASQKWMSKHSYAMRTAGRVMAVYGGVVTAILGKAVNEMLNYQMALADVSTMIQLEGSEFTSTMDQFDQAIRKL